MKRTIIKAEALEFVKLSDSDRFMQQQIEIMTKLKDQSGKIRDALMELARRLEEVNLMHKEGPSLFTTTSN